MVELVQQKGKANFCDFFVFSNSPQSDERNKTKEQARKMLDNLFKQ